MIAKWKLKAVVQKTISFFPQRERLNYWFQRYVTQGVQLTDEHFGYKARHASDHIRYFRHYGQPTPDSRIIELGTGWYPIVPLFMYLTGTGRVTSLDIQDWMTYESQLTAVRKIQEWRALGKLDDLFPHLLPERWAALLQVLETPDRYDRERFNELIRLTPLLQDARRTAFPTQSIDFICSNNTFEHIYPDVLEGILAEFKRLLRPGGVMSHFVDLSDHFAHFDSSINIYNFLRYSRRQWERIDNSIQPQNRLRWRDYQQMYARVGIPITEEATRPGDLRALEQVPLHAEYSSYPAAELAISHGYLVTKG